MWAISNQACKKSAEMYAILNCQVSSKFQVFRDKS